MPVFEDSIQTVSYCQKDKVYADNIDLYFKEKDICMHRDIRDISEWEEHP
jgi:hypothetical protein